MKKLLTKKNVLFGALGLLVFVLVISNPLAFGFCQSVSEYASGTKYCNYSYNIIDQLAKTIGFIGLFASLPILLFSLLTYRMHDEVFERWISFAQWYVPVLVVITLFINSANGGGSGGIGGAVSGWFYGIVIGALYVLFVIISLTKIISAYRHSKKSK